MNRKVVVIIQARMGSTRLPGKMLMQLAGRPIVLQVCERVALINGIDKVVVATTTEEKDDLLVRHCLQNGISVFRGSPDDVLDRYYQAAKQESADVVMRVTGDCPFLDPVESEKVLKLFLDNEGCDYATNVDPPFLPDGLDTEVISFRALQRSWQMAKNVPDREHVTLFIRHHPDLFSVKSLKGNIDLSSNRWTIDEGRDYEFLNAVAKRLAEKDQFGYLNEILALLDEDPDISKINRDIRRNEGLERSLRQNPLSD